MDQQTTTNNPPGYFEQALSLLGIAPSSVTAGSLQTSASSATLTDDANAESLIKPMNITFISSAAKDSFLSFAQIDMSKGTGFPMQLNTYNASEITVTPDNPLVINSGAGNPVIVNIETLTLQPGARIQCNCGVIFSINNFIKQ